MNLEAMSWADDAQVEVLICTDPSGPTHLIGKPEREAAVEPSQRGHRCDIGQRLTYAVPPTQHTMFE